VSDSDTKHEVVPMAPESKYCIEFPATGVAGVDTIKVSGQDSSIFDHLRSAVMSGLARGDSKAIVQSRGWGGQWTQREGAIRSLPELQSLYWPLHHRFFTAVKYGALAGLLLETLHQSWQLYQHYHSIVPTFAALVVCSLSGALLGTSLAGCLAGAWILYARGRFKVAPDAAPENIDKYRAWTVILLVAFSWLLITYAGGARNWPLVVEQYLRADIGAHPPG
jgi:hypothetical protein